MMRNVPSAASSLYARTCCHAYVRRCAIVTAQHRRIRRGSKGGAAVGGQAGRLPLPCGLCAPARNAARCVFDIVHSATNEDILAQSRGTKRKNCGGGRAVKKRELGCALACAGTPQLPLQSLSELCTGHTYFECDSTACKWELGACGGTASL